ncbi:MAG: hypothetical protein ACNA7M_11200 [Roseovarius sp.]
MSLWNDFNDAQSNSNIIPKGTLAKVRLTLRPGGFDDPAQGWTGGYAKRGGTGAVFLDAEYTVLEGPYAKRKIWSMIGLYSPNGPNWANMGRSLIRGILNSSRGISDKDNSPEAQARRRIAGFHELDGVEFVARIDVGSDSNGEEKNEIKSALAPNHRDYATVMGLGAPAMSGAPAAPYHAPPSTPPQASPMQQGYSASPPQAPRQPVQAPAQPPASPGFPGRPSWAE